MWKYITGQIKKAEEGEGLPADGSVHFRRFTHNQKVGFTFHSIMVQSVMELGHLRPEGILTRMVSLSTWKHP